MKTYWNVAVSVDGRLVCSSGDATMEQAIAKGISDCVYYAAVNPGSKVQIDELTEACERCHNIGTIGLRRPRSTKTVKCPECKGKLATGKCGPIPFVMPDPANRISIVQGA